MYTHSVPTLTIWNLTSTFSLHGRRAEDVGIDSMGASSTRPARSPTAPSRAGR